MEIESSNISVGGCKSSKVSTTSSTIKQLFTSPSGGESNTVNLINHLVHFRLQVCTVCSVIGVVG